MARTPNDPLREQLDALVGGGVPSDVREQHLAGIRAHIASLGPATITAGRRSGVRWEARRRVAALGAAGSLVVPGVAVASQGSVPGDALFGVKKATEAVVGVVDGRAAATNRLEELEAFLDRGASLDVLAAALERAAVAVAALDDADDLEARLSLLEARVEALIEAAEAEAEAAREAQEREPAVAPSSSDDRPSSSPSASEDDDESEDDDTDEPSSSPSASEDDDETTDDDDRSPSPRPSASDDDETDDDEPSPRPTLSEPDDDETDDDETDDEVDNSGSGNAEDRDEPDDDETDDD